MRRQWARGRGAHSIIVLDAHYERDGAIIFNHACILDGEGVVSKRLGSTYQSGRSPHWVKVKSSSTLACANV